MKPNHLLKALLVSLVLTVLALGALGQQQTEKKAPSDEKTAAATKPSAAQCQEYLNTLHGICDSLAYYQDTLFSKINSIAKLKKIPDLTAERRNLYLFCFRKLRFVYNYPEVGGMPDLWISLAALLEDYKNVDYDFYDLDHLLGKEPGEALVSCLDKIEKTLKNEPMEYVYFVGYEVTYAEYYHLTVPPAKFKF